MKIIRLTESDLTNIVKRVIRENDSMLEKNKKFLTNLMGIDFTGKIEQITSIYDVPMEFDRYISTGMINRYLNKFGPMYLFELDGHRYLYLDVGDHEKFIDEKGNVFIENEIPERQIGRAHV